MPTTIDENINRIKRDTKTKMKPRFFLLEKNVETSEAR